MVFNGSTGESGNFIGHAIPGAFFLGIGLFFLLLSLRRARSLPPGRGFCETHVPERNSVLLKTLGFIVLGLTSLGILVEGTSGCLDFHDTTCFFYQSEHMILYLVYGSVAPILLLEAAGRLPPDSCRAMLSLSLLLSYLLWNEHAIMKKDSTDNRVHALTAQLSLVQAVTMALSVFKPLHLVLFIASWGLFVLKSVWLFTAGVNAEFVKIPVRQVGPLFCLEVVLVTLGIVLVGVCFGPKTTFSNGSGEAIQKSEYERLNLSAGSSQQAEEGDDIQIDVV